MNTSPRRVRRICLVAGCFASVLCAYLFIRAASNEWNGTATYYKYAKAPAEQVTREAAPEKFRQATNFVWGAGAICLLAGVGCFTFFRRIDDVVDGF